MKLGAILGALAGFVLAAWLLVTNFDEVLTLLARAGIGLAIVIAFHGVQIIFSAAAWRVVTGPTSTLPSLVTFMVMRWIREAVNNLLPVAQIGGEVVAARLLRLRDVPFVTAVAGVTVDLTLEMMTQIAFTLVGLSLLFLGGADTAVSGWVLSGLWIAILAAGGFLTAQWLGLARYIEKGLLRVGNRMGWSSIGKIEGLHAAIIKLYRRPRRLGLAGINHMVSWLLGGIEVCLALHFLGQDIGLREGLIIESLGQVSKAAGFAIPGALGIQEGGYIVVCGLFGLSPELALALSLVKRTREVVLGLPGLMAWHRFERRRPIAEAVPEATS